MCVHVCACMYMCMHVCACVFMYLNLMSFRNVLNPKP
jgi:hypothetical protein